MSHEKEMFTVVKRIAWSIGRRLPSHVSIDDLIGAGAVGLAEAYQRRGTMSDDAFRAYASARIHGAIFDELRRIDPLSRRMRRIAKALDIAVAKGGSQQSLAEIAAELGVNDEVLGHIEEARNTGEGSRLSVLPAANDNSPEELVSLKESLSRARRATQTLTKRMREVMKAKYEDDENQRDTARKLGVTEARVSQLHTDALRRVVELSQEAEVA